MRPTSSELFAQVENSMQGLLGSLVEEEQKKSDEDETILQLLREEKIETTID